MADSVFGSVFYTSSKLGASGLTVTADLYQVSKSDGSASKIVSDGSASAIGGGLYDYNHASASTDLYYYLGIFKTSDSTVDQQHLPVWLARPTEGATQVSNLVWTDTKAGLSTGNVALDATVAKAASALSNGVWTDTKAGYLDMAISDAKSASVSVNWPWGLGYVTNLNFIATTGATIQAIRGDSNTLAFHNGFQVVPDNVRFYVRQKLDGNTVLGLWASSASGQFNSSASTIQVSLLPGDTDGKPAGTWIYDLEVTTGSQVSTLYQGNFVLKGDVATTASLIVL